MGPELQYRKAPQEQLQTWSLVLRIFTWTSIGAAIVLLLMAWFLV